MNLREFEALSPNGQLAVLSLSLVTSWEDVDTATRKRIHDRARALKVNE